MLDWYEIAKGGISAGWGLVGVGSWATGRHQRIERRNSRIKDQLTQFYAPLRGMRADIKAKSDLREKISAIANGAFRREFTGVDDPDTKRRIGADAWPKYEKLAVYSDDQLKTDIIPTYRKMVQYFMSHMAYAEESTIIHYAAFVEFVEIWNRFSADSLPRKVAQDLSHAEKNLYPLYDNIEDHARRFSWKLKSEPWLWQGLVEWRSNRRCKRAEPAK